MRGFDCELVNFVSFGLIHFIEYVQLIVFYRILPFYGVQFIRFFVKIIQAKKALKTLFI